MRRLIFGLVAAALTLPATADVRLSLTTGSTTELSQTVCSETTTIDSPCQPADSDDDTPVSTLNDGLVAYWSLEDVSDSVGGHTLTNNGSTTFVAAKNNNGANFVAASLQSLSSTSDDLRGDQNFTVACWIDPNLAGQTAGVSRDAASRDYSLLISNTTFQVYYLNSSQAANVSQANPGAGFHLVIFYLDRDNNRLGISVNDAVPTTTAVSGSYTTYSGIAFRIGGNTTSGFSTSVIDECAFWSRVLTSDERTELYAAGAGKFYPFP